MTLSKPPAAGASKLGRYELIKELSGSGVATTWLARVTDTLDLFTVLRLHKHVAKSTEVAEEFVTAGRWAHKLEHPGVVPIVDTGVADGEVFTVSPHLEGDNLANLTRNAGTLGLLQPVVLRIALDILEAVEAAHAMAPPLVHGELNPWNIHVGTDGHTRIAGFGVARALAKIGLHGIKNHDRLAYAAPERVKVMASTHAPSDETVAPASDLFSIGVMMWECYTRQRLFSSRMEAAIIQKVLTSPIGPPSGTGVELPAEVEEALMKVLERDVDKRDGSATDFIKSLVGAGANRIATHQDVAAQLEKFCGRSLKNRKQEIEAALSNERKPSLRPTTPRGAKSLLHMAMAKPAPLPKMDGEKAEAEEPPKAPPTDGPAKPKRKRRPPRRVATLLGVAAPVDGDGDDQSTAKATPSPPEEDPAPSPPVEASKSEDEAPEEAKGEVPKSVEEDAEELIITMETFDDDDNGAAKAEDKASAKEDNPGLKKAPPPPPRAGRPKPPAPPRKAGAKPPAPNPVVDKPATPKASSTPARSTTPTAGTPVAAAKTDAAKDELEQVAGSAILDEPTEIDDRADMEPLKTPPSHSGDSAPRPNQRGKAGLSVDQVGPGKMLGQYEIIAPIARGGMASVWLGRIKDSRQATDLVAVKTMLPDVSDDPDFEKMFLDEARVAAKIKHTNVVEIYDLAEQAHVLYLAMEYVDGETVGQLQRSAKPIGGIPAGVVARIGAQGCAGLHAAHELRDDKGQLLELVHRDISPGNILLTADGIVKIVDFGIAKSKGRLHVTRAGSTVKGKTPYLSPEQLGGLAIDRRSDLFSFGALLYVLVTGLHPFRGASELQTIENIALKEPVKPRELNRDCPEGLQAIILKALTKDPRKRFASAEEMGKALEDELAKMSEPTTDDDVKAFIRKALGETLDRRDRNVKAAIAKLDGVTAEAAAPPADEPGSDENAADAMVAAAPMFPPPERDASTEADTEDVEPRVAAAIESGRRGDGERLAPTKPMFGTSASPLITEDTPSAAERDVDLADDDRFDKTRGGGPDPRRRRVLQMAVTGMVVGLGILGLVAIFTEDGAAPPAPAAGAPRESAPTPVATPEPPPATTQDPVPVEEPDAGAGDEEDAGVEDAGEEEVDAAPAKPVVKQPHRPWKPPPKQVKKYDPTGI